MIPYVLAAVGGYLIGDSMKGIGANKYADGGRINNEELKHYQELENKSISVQDVNENLFGSSQHSLLQSIQGKRLYAKERMHELGLSDDSYLFLLKELKEVKEKFDTLKEEQKSLIKAFLIKRKKNFENIPTQEYLQIVKRLVAHKNLKATAEEVFTMEKSLPEYSHGGIMAVGGNVSKVYDRKLEFLKYILANTSKFNSSIKDFTPEIQNEIKKSIKNANDFIKEDSSNKKKFNQVAPTLYKNLFIVNTPIWTKISRKYFLDKDDSNFLMQEEKIMAGGGITDNKYNYAVYFNRMVGGSRVPVVADIFKNKEEAEMYSGTHRTYKFQEISKLPTQSEVAISTEEKRKYLKNIVHSKEKVDEFFKGKDSFYKKNYSWVMPEGYRWDNWQIVSAN